MKMLKKRKVGFKLAAGFGIVILLLCLFGALAIRKIQSVSGQANVLLKSFLPEALVGHEMKTAMMESMFCLRGYASSRDGAILIDGLRKMQEFKDHLLQAESLGATNGNLTVLRANTEKLHREISDYEMLVNSTSNCVQLIQIYHQQQDQAAEKFNKACQDCIRTERSALLEDLKTNAPVPEISAHVKNLNQLEFILDAGNSLRLANFKFQALGQAQIVETNLALFDDIKDALKLLEQQPRPDFDRALLTRIGSTANDYREAMRSFMTNNTALLTFNDRRNQAGQQVKALLDNINSAASGGVRIFADNTSLQLNQVLTFTLSGLAAVVIVSLIVSTRQTRSLTRPIVAAARFAGEIAQGNLATHLKIEQEDELGDLASALNQMNDQLRGQLGEINHAIKAVSGLTTSIQEAVSVLTTSSAQITTTTAQVAAATTETAGAVSETTTSIEEVNHTALNSSEKAKLVAENAKTVEQAAQYGRKAVDESLESMKRIQIQMETIGTTIGRLSEQSQAIGEIIASVSDLAEQSNLLAVNAGIEAAKAGEQGKGFAVVAQEVKSLADQSKQATSQVRSILNDIQKAIGAAVMATELGNKIVESGVNQTEAMNNTIRTLNESINTAAQSATQIAFAMQQMHIGMEQVSSAMDNIKRASEQNVVGIKQTETAARNLKELGYKLTQLTQQSNELGTKLMKMMERYRV